MEELTHLGKQSSDPVEQLDRIPWEGSPLVVRLNCSEFTSHCPVTRQPDFGKLIIEYVPDQFIAETKSVKLYLWQFRQQAQFNERLADGIALDIYTQLEPKALRVTGAFNPRGGISVTATATYGDESLLP